MPVTIRQIAEHAGVSRQTVSAILGTKAELYRPETRASVMRAVDDLGYRLNPSARAIGQGRFGAIGVLMSTVSQRSVLGQAIDGIQQGVSNANLAVRFCHVTDEDLTDEDYLRQLPTQLAVDGLLVNYTHQFPPALTAILDRYRIPSIWMNVKQDHDCVHADDAGAGPIAVKYLRSLGHRRIGYGTYAVREDSHYSVPGRLDGYMAAMQEAGLKTDVFALPRGAGSEPLMERLSAWLKRDDRPTAVFAASLSEAVALHAAAMRVGFEVPRDLSILAIASQAEGAIGVELDAIRLPSNDVGCRAVELLRRKIRHPERRLPTEVIPMQFEEYGERARSCAPPPSDEVDSSSV
jgi:LacI family transcriptional regulator